ncbi:hypothetical protein ACFL0V_05310 [Nanoarchaeota archaeon]
MRLLTSILEDLRLSGLEKEVKEANPDATRDFERKVMALCHNMRTYIRHVAQRTYDQREEDPETYTQTTIQLYSWRTHLKMAQNHWEGKAPLDNKPRQDHSLFNAAELIPIYHAAKEIYDTSLKDIPRSEWPDKYLIMEAKNSIEVNDVYHALCQKPRERSWLDLNYRAALGSYIHNTQRAEQLYDQAAKTAAQLADKLKLPSPDILTFHMLRSK